MSENTFVTLKEAEDYFKTSGALAGSTEGAIFGAILGASRAGVISELVAEAMLSEICPSFKKRKSDE